VEEEKDQKEEKKENKSRKVKVDGEMLMSKNENKTGNR